MYKLILVVLGVLAKTLVFADTWTDPITGLTWTYTLARGEVSIGGGDANHPALASKPCSHITIPAFIDGHPVTAIGKFAFYCSYNLPSVEIPSGVKVIGCYAFYECNDLVPPTIPSTVVDIQECAFGACFALKSISLPSSVTNLGTCAFTSSGLTAIVIPEGVLNIGQQAFSGCKELKMVYISKTVETLGNGAFSCCPELSSVVLSEGIKNIEDNAFCECYELTSIDIPASVKKFGYKCFSECGKLSVVTLREGLLAIGSEAFANCKALTTITIPSTVETLPSGLFYNCDNLVSVEIRPGVVSFQSSVFDHCLGLKALIIPPSVAKLSSHSFRNCPNLAAIYFRGNAPSVSGNPFSEMEDSLVIYVPEGSFGWDGKGSTTLPKSWCDHAIVYGDPESAEKYTSYDVVFVNTSVPNQHWDENKGYWLPCFKGWMSSKDGGVYGGGMPVKDMANPGEKVFLTAVWDYASPISTLGHDQITVIVTEVMTSSSGAIAVPESWSDRYPKFESKFGNDFTKALSMKTGKRDGAGNDMFVWQDYVAGTDPTKEDDVFKASITVVDGKVMISHFPELDDERRAMRKYTNWGKKNLSDERWTEVPEGQESDYNFFKVSVEMR